MTDTVIGIQYKDGVILAADQMNASSILVYQENLDKIVPLTKSHALGVSGPNCDAVNFSEYVAKNLELYLLANDYYDDRADGSKKPQLSTHAVANFCRNELATALRKGPYQVNLLLGGFDDKEGPSLYFMDHLAAMHRVPYGVQGYAQYFCTSIFDKDYQPDCSQEDAMKMVEKCIYEMQTRFLISQKNFLIKIVDKEGIKTLRFGADPADS